MFGHAKYLLPALFCLLLSHDSAAQTRDTRSRNARKKKELFETVDQVAKINISGLALRAFSLQYERKLNRSKTFGIGLIYRPNFATPFVRYILQDTNFTASAETMNMLKTAKYNAWMLTPELRFYFRKKAPRGIYLAPFLRYKRETFSADFRYQQTGSGSSGIQTALYKAKVNTLGVGLLFGLQILAKNKMTIDFWFLGPWVGMEFVKTSGKAGSSSLNEYDRAYIESGTEGYNRFFGFSNSYNWSGNRFGSKSNDFTYGARILGINFGYSF